MFDISKFQPQEANHFATLELPVDHFMLQPYLLAPGAKLLVGGQAKIGKTFLLLNMIRALVTGEPLFGNPEWVAKPSKVLFVEREVGPYIIGQRVKMVMGGAPSWAVDNEHFQILSQPRGFTLSKSDCMKTLASYADDNGINVVVLDPINKLHHYDENDSSQMLRLVESLEEALDGKRALIMSHHFGKPLRGQDAQGQDRLDPYNFRGSSRLIDDVENMMTLVRNPGRLVPAWESWSWDVRFSGGRLGPLPEDFKLEFNRLNDGRVYYMGLLDDLAGQRDALNKQLKQAEERSILSY